MPRIHLALVHGGPREESGVIEEAIDTSRKRKVRLDLEGKPALTRWEVAERFRGYALLRAWPETGRTHQIRVHLAHAGFPIVGDTLYGLVGPWIERHALHARKLALRHPRTGEAAEFDAPLPADLAALAARAGVAVPAELLLAADGE